MLDAHEYGPPAALRKGTKPYTVEYGYHDIDKSLAFKSKKPYKAVSRLKKQKSVRNFLKLCLARLQARGSESGQKS